MSLLIFLLATVSKISNFLVFTNQQSVTTSNQSSLQWPQCICNMHSENKIHESLLHWAKLDWDPILLDLIFATDPLTALLSSPLSFCRYDIGHVELLRRVKNHEMVSIGDIGTFCMCVQQIKIKPISTNISKIYLQFVYSMSVKLVRIFCRLYILCQLMEC